MIELILSYSEAVWLRDLMQNPINGNDESIDKKIMRHSFFEALNEGLGESHRNINFNPPDDIPF